MSLLCCGYDFREDRITDRVFQCFPSSPLSVTYHAQLHGTLNANATDLFAAIQEWVSPSVTIPIQLLPLTVSSVCAVISSIPLEHCPGEVTTQVVPQQYGTSENIEVTSRSSIPSEASSPDFPEESTRPMSDVGDSSSMYTPTMPEVTPGIESVFNLTHIIIAAATLIVIALAIIAIVVTIVVCALQLWTSQLAIGEYYCDTCVMYLYAMHTCTTGRHHILQYKQWS